MTTPFVAQALTATSALRSATSDSGSALAGRAGLVVLLLGAASLAWWVVSRRAARFRNVHSGPRHRQAAGGYPATNTARLTGTDLGKALGARATFVQFSAQTCATCPQVSRTLTSLSETEQGVVHVDLPAEDHMDLVRQFSVFRTPTVLLLDAGGTVHSRTSGPLTPRRAMAALSQLAQPTARSTHV